MDLALNNLQRLIYHKTQQANQPTINIPIGRVFTNGLGNQGSIPGQVISKNSN